MQAARFFGPGMEYLNDWAIPKQKAKLPETEAEWVAAGAKQGISPKPGESLYSFKERVKI